MRADVGDVLEAGQVFRVAGIDGLWKVVSDDGTSPLPPPVIRVLDGAARAVWSPERTVIERIGD